ncbi:peroxisomal and mitochondrial division factor 2 [Prunus yedoensis var. nudiflora]|uniref:Peroxisomal and mitochondrial division factor 2 n=1 Tax=Prunus yedoensis var. nudiflora TaxID=2094558 RepID=A0A314YYI4_PRUYE|nr:peroxisomal and mitochondrial division factor 2 [Prunus yedoensis var. nudiflora]
MELKMGKLQKDVVEADKVINGLRERTVGAINGTVNEMEILESGETGPKGLSLPVVAGSTGAIVAVAAAAVYVLYLRPR